MFSKDLNPYKNINNRFTKLAMALPPKHTPPLDNPYLVAGGETGETVPAEGQSGLREMP